LIDTHRGAFEYDWRTRCGEPLSAVGRSTSWGEAIRLTQKLITDPSTQVAAAMNGWDYPVSWDAIVAMNHFDLIHQIAWAQGGRKGPKPKPYPRPWPDRRRETLKAGAGVSQEDILKALAFAGHTGPVPTR
jgi:hypothetical protein